MTMQGTDPEFFIVDGKGKPVSAHHFYPDKDHKVSVLTSIGTGKYFRDGFALEVNAVPTTCRGNLMNSLRTLIRTAAAVLPKDHALITAPSVEVDLEALKDAPEDVRMFGCDPSRDAYAGGAEKIVDVDGMNHPRRYAGGHLHFSQGLEAEKAKTTIWADPEMAAEAVKWLDLYLGLPLTLIFHRPEAFQRRELYGQAGEFRLQTYPAGPYNNNGYFGIEYRVPGADTFNHQAIISMAFGAGRNILRRLWAREIMTWDSKIEDDLRAAINKGDEKLGWGLLQEFRPWYTPDTIKALQKLKLFTFQFPVMSTESHVGITEFLGHWGIASPVAA